MEKISQRVRRHSYLHFVTFLLIRRVQVPKKFYFQVRFLAGPTKDSEFDSCSQKCLVSNINVSFGWPVITRPPPPPRPNEVWLRPKFVSLCFEPPY